MSEQLRIADIKDITEEMKGEILRELRKEASYINEMIKEGKSEIIAVIFSESRKIRQDIGYQTMMLKILEDNLSSIQFDEETGISSKIEVYVFSSNYNHFILPPFIPLLKSIFYRKTSIL